MTERLLPRAEVQLRTGLSKSTIYARMAAGTFPLPRKEADGPMVRWLESEINAWIEEWIASSVVGTTAGSRREATKKPLKSAA